MNRKLSPNAYEMVDHYIGSVAYPDIGEPVAFCGSCEWIGHPDDFDRHRERALKAQREELDQPANVRLHAVSLDSTPPLHPDWKVQRLTKESEHGR